MATLPFHDFIDHLGVELDLQVAQRRLQLLKILQLVRDSISTKMTNF